MASLVAAPALGALLWGSGYALLGAIGCRSSSRLMHGALSIGAGLALLVLVLQLALLVTGEACLGLGAAVVVTTAAAGWGLALVRGSLGTPGISNAPLALLVVLGTTVLIATTTTPFFGYDAKAIYALKAKALLHEGNLDGPLFQDTEVVHYHADYPLGLPLVMALAAWSVHGSPADPTGEEPAARARDWVERYDAIDAYQPAVAVWICTLALLVASAVWARERDGFARLLLGLLAVPVVALFPWLGGGSWSPAGADLPLALCLGCAYFAVRRGLEEPGRPWLVLTALLTASAPLFKTDAITSLASLLVALGLHARTRRGGGLAAAVVVGSAIGIGSWLVVRSGTAGAPYDEQYVDALASTSVGDALGRVQVLVSSIVDTLDEQKMLVYWIAVLAIAVPVGWRRGGTAAFAATWLVLSILACTAIFFVTPNHVAWHVSTALPRLWCQMIVPAAVLTVEAAIHLWSPGSSR